MENREATHSRHSSSGAHVNPVSSEKRIESEVEAEKGAGARERKSQSSGEKSGRGIETDMGAKTTIWREIRQHIKASQLKSPLEC